MEALEDAFKVNRKDVKLAKTRVERFDPEESEAEVAKFMVWCRGNKTLQFAFTDNAKAWAAYQKVAKVMRSGEELAAAMSKRGDVDVVASAEFQVSLANKGTADAPTGPTKEQRTEANRAKREEEERQRQKEEADRIEAERRKKVEQDQQARLASTEAYSRISMTNPIAKAAWDQGVAEYVRSRTGEITLGISGTRDELEKALANWASRASAVADVGGVFTGISKFPKPQDKAAKGGSQVGDTLDTRAWQANFILFLSKTKGGPRVNVHVDMTGA